MTFEIKDEKTCALIKELAALTGESLTEVITKSVSERLRIISDRKQRLLEIGRECATSLDTDDLYDDNGLPK